MNAKRVLALRASGILRVFVPICALLVAAPVEAQQPDPRQQTAGTIQIFAPEQHDLYDGRFVISAGRIYMVGSLRDPEGCDHVDNEARNVHPVAGSA
jgi:hypothetical protein